MSMSPDASNAPTFSAGQTPDARPITLADALNVALQHLQQDNPTPEAMYQLKAFYMASQKIMQMKAQQAAGGMGQPGGQPAAPMGPNGAGPPAPAAGGSGGSVTQDYGTGFGDDVPGWQGPSGRQ